MRYNPALPREGKNPLTLDSKPPALPLKQYVYNESRYTMLVQGRPDVARDLLRLAEQDVRDRWNLYERLAAAPAELAAAPVNGAAGEKAEGRAAR